MISILKPAAWCSAVLPSYDRSSFYIYTTAQPVISQLDNQSTIPKTFHVPYRITELRASSIVQQLLCNLQVTFASCNQ